ncbi:MAG TPA: phytoene/squalene synthase family protein [Polyangiaceae bacterium]|nr:phytoene/squalene synthase family protein [Polyangiaceae bacterium]
MSVNEADWAYCEQALVDVSRTFSKPIELLPRPLRVALTCAYLLCRVVDTVEDHEQLGSQERDGLFTSFIAVLDGVQSPESFSARFAAFGDDDPALRLVQSLPRVMNVFLSQDPDTRRVSITWLSEMANGMRLYCRRDRPGALTIIDSVSDLERYCYFVAGTVGHLITDLFSAWLGSSGSALELELRARCESFGIGLQLVNILKDVTEDFARNRCYVPRQLCQIEGFSRENLLSSEHRSQAHRALAPIFERAGEHLGKAFEYVLLIPAEQVELRLFCLLPLWMALETLVLAIGNDAVLIADRPVKISREAVGDLIQDCLRNAGDDAALRRRYASSMTKFKERLVKLTPPSRSKAGAREGYARV